MRIVKLIAVLVTAAVWLALGASAAAALTFTPPIHYAVGGQPRDIASGDLDGNGLPDIVVVGPRQDSVAVLLATGNGRFAPAVHVPLAHEPRAVALGDLNGDGALDIVATDGTYPDWYASVFLGRGDGTFVLRGDFATIDPGYDVAFGDVTSDGQADVVTGGVSGPVVLAGDGKGGLQAPLSVTTGAQCNSVVLADLDQDGHLDVVATRYEFEEYHDFIVLLSDGAGGFQPPVAYRGGLEPNALAAGDLNGDGKPDVAYLDSLDGSGDVTALLGDGLGMLIPASGIRVDPRDGPYIVYSGLALGDLDRNGFTDVVTTGDDPPLIYVLLSHKGDGAFFTRLALPSGRTASAVVVDDFNGDGKDDFATSDFKAGSVSVRIKGSLPVLTGISPGAGKAGSVVTLTGRRFLKYRYSGEVRFGGVPVTAYLSWSNTAIKVRVPFGTPRRLVNVTVMSIIGKSGAKKFLSR